MSDRSTIKAIIDQFFEALNSNDVSNVPLAYDVELASSLQPEPLTGEASVRQHLQETAPFMQNIHSTRIIIENGAVASLIEFDVVNGTHFESAYFFDIEAGKIKQIRAIFDTKELFQ